MTSLTIPVADDTVRVRMINTTAVMVVNAKSFVEPVQKGHELLNLPVAAFLVEHRASGRKIMFDLGVRKDYWNLPAALQKRLGTVIPALRVDRDATEILQENGIPLEQISSVIWSHYHWDHTGSMELFPESTDLVVGPGFKESPALLPGFPHLPDSPIDARAIEGRKLIETDFESSALNIGGFRAHDFFGDGSFYLLDTPGHCLGHLCALARTTGGTESTFVFLGGDICHFPGVVRPTENRLLPDPVPNGVLDPEAGFPSPCPCSFFADHHPQAGKRSGKTGMDTRATPFYNVSTDASAAYKDPTEAQRSVNKLTAFDGSPSVLICLAHDGTMLDRLPTLNMRPEDDLNDWQARGYRDLISWGWLNELPRGGRPGREHIVEGFWRDGRPWSEAKAVLRKNGELASKMVL